MGYSISWIGLKGAKRNSLELLNMRDTGIEDEVNEAPLSAAETKAGWTIIWSNDIRFGGDEPKFAQLSKTAPIIVCFIEEHTMFSLAMFLQNGEAVWSISHQGDGGDIFNLEKTGDLPGFAAEIEAEQIGKQKAEGGRDAGVDYVFDVPLLIAKRVSGFKHDEMGPSFTVVRPK